MTSHLKCCLVASSRTNVVVSAGFVDHVTTYGLSDFAIVFRSVRPSRFTVIVALAANWSFWFPVPLGPLTKLHENAPVTMVRSKVEPFIITLGGSICFQGIALLMSKSREITMPGHELDFVKSNLFETTTAGGTKIQLPIYIILFVVIAVIVWLVLKYTKYGRRVYAVGANPSAAFLAGVNVKNLKFSTYVINGLLVGIASIVLLGRVGTAIITNGQGAEINVIACVVIGGVAMSGGKGNGMGTFLGVLLLGAITNAMNVLGLRSEWQYVVKGAIIIAAVAISAVATKIAAARSLARQRQEAMAEQKGE